LRETNAVLRRFSVRRLIDEIEAGISQGERVGIGC
jgi:hypothetical protein